MKTSARLFGALANDLRLRVVNLLLERPLCVCEMVSILGVPYSKLSNHLAILKAAGLTGERKQGWWVQHFLKSFSPSSAEASTLKSVRILGRKSRIFQKDLSSLKTYNGKRPPEEICCLMLQKGIRAAKRKTKRG